MLMCNLMFLLGQRWPHIPEAEGASEGWCDILLQVSFSILHFIIIYINNVYLGAGQLLGYSSVQVYIPFVKQNLHFFSMPLSI